MPKHDQNTNRSQTLAPIARTYNLIYLAYLIRKANEGCLLLIMNNHIFDFSSLFEPQKKKLIILSSKFLDFFAYFRLEYK